ncbi:MAG TPA: hypothetical protein GXX29_01595 [Firmicutes bacterium]|nr:hypothetical protein [Bacillota bacterium]
MAQKYRHRNGEKAARRVVAVILLLFLAGGSWYVLLHFAWPYHSPAVGVPVVTAREAAGNSGQLEQLEITKVTWEDIRFLQEVLSELNTVHGEGNAAGSYILNRLEKTAAGLDLKITEVKLQSSLANTGFDEVLVSVNGEGSHLSLAEFLDRLYINEPAMEVWRWTTATHPADPARLTFTLYLYVQIHQGEAARQ